MKINIVFHHQSVEFLEYAEKLFSMFYRNIHKPLDKSLMIDTYLIKLKNNEHDMNDYKDDICIYLFDDKMVNINIKNISANSLAIINTSYIANSSWNSSNLYLNIKDVNVELEIWTYLAKYLYQNNTFKLFLSHTKQDLMAEKLAKDYHSFISLNTKINSFIDIQHISYSENIKENIDKHLPNSIFIGFESDEYANSYWTQYEITQAKKYDLPIILIQCIKYKNIKRFPYLGNCMILNDTGINNINNNLKEIIIEAIRLKINETRMSFYKEIFNSNIEYLNNNPEIFNINYTNEDIIIYPDPPITNIEQEILSSFRNKAIHTPLSYITKDSIKKNIGISISEVNDDFDNGFENIHLQTAHEEITKYLLYAKNKIIYGGDIKYKGKFNFMKIFADICVSYKIKESIINYVCYPLNNNINDEIIAKYKHMVEFKTFNKLNIRNEVMPYTDKSDKIGFANNLSLMREEMAKQCDARIMLGGKHIDYLGKYPGLLEEAYYTLKANKPLYLIGAFGGVSKLMINLINGKEVKELTYDWQYNHLKNTMFSNLIDSKKINVCYNTIIEVLKTKPLNNLSKEDNEKLFYSTSIEEITFYILKGLKNE